MSESTSLLALVLGFLPGAVGGFNNVLIGHPVDVIKVQQQTAHSRVPAAGNFTLLRQPQAPTTTMGRMSTISMLRHIAVTEGFGGLYAGVTAPLLAVVPAFALTFWSFDFAARVQTRYFASPKQQQQQQNSKYNLTMVQVLTAGGFSGIPLALVLGPLERIKCLMQVDRTRYRGFVDCVRHVYRQGGVRSVFRGTAMTMARDIPGNAAYFGAYHFTKRTLQPPDGDPSQLYSIGVTLLAGGLAGVANWVVAIPFDVVKSIWQTAAPGTYHSPRHVVQTLLEKEGPAALFRGLSPALIRAFPASAACIMGVETTEKVIDTWMKMA